MKIYVASSWRNPYQPDVVGKLRLAGHDPYDFRNPGGTNRGFAWSDIDPNWQSWTTEDYVKALRHPLAEKGYKLDIEAMRESRVCVLVLPAGRSANLEAGWFVGAGRPLFVFQPERCEPELMYKMSHGVFAQLPDLIAEMELRCR